MLRNGQESGWGGFQQLERQADMQPDIRIVKIHAADFVDALNAVKQRVLMDEQTLCGERRVFGAGDIGAQRMQIVAVVLPVVIDHRAHGVAVEGGGIAVAAKDGQKQRQLERVKGGYAAAGSGEGTL